MAEKIYIVKQSKTQGNPMRSEPDRVRFVRGTALRIAEYYGVPPMKTPAINSIVKKAQKVYADREAACYNRTYLDLVTEIPEGASVSDLVARDAA